MSSTKERVRLGKKSFIDSKAFLPGNEYDKWEIFFKEAAEYSGDNEKLYNQQAAIDHELAMHARRVRLSLFSEQ